jgi:hypothetical protein
MEDNPGKVTLAADFGAGRQADLEFESPNTLWLAAGTGIGTADIWMKGVGGEIDLRVRIVRVGKALEVIVDRGEQSKNWWPDDSVPRLLVVLDPTEGTVSARASLGQANQAQRIESEKLRY